MSRYLVLISVRDQVVGQEAIQLLRHVSVAGARRAARIGHMYYSSGTSGGDCDDITNVSGVPFICHKVILR